MFVEGKRDGSEGLASEFDAGHLDGNCNDEDDDEEGVVEEVGEDVEFGFLEFSGVDLVEDLHQDKGVEEDAVVFACLCSPLADADGRLDAHEFGT